VAGGAAARPRTPRAGPVSCTALTSQDCERTG